MHIPRSYIDEGLIALDTDENAVFERLGKELAIIEQQANQSLGTRLDAEQYRQKAMAYFEIKKDLLQNAICPNWRGKTRDEFSDMGDVLLALSIIIAEALNLSQSYIGLAVLLAVIVLKRGIDVFCS